MCRLNEKLVGAMIGRRAFYGFTENMVYETSIGDLLGPCSLVAVGSDCTLLEWPGIEGQYLAPS
jgi:hypothetical protein